MAKFTPSKGLEARVAKRLEPEVTRITRAAARGAQDAAPPEKQWKSRGDALVRPEHAKAHDQTVPDNLRFTLDSPTYDQFHYGAGMTQMGRKPRDEAFTPGLTANCRCWTETIPDGVSKTIEAHPARAAGTRVTGRVTCDHELAVPAEYGTGADQGARFMAAGLRAGKRAAKGR